MTDLQQMDVSSRTITAFFDTREAADKASAHLVDAGIPREHITITGRDATARTTTQPDDDKGFWDSLKDMFLPEEDRHTYAEGLRRGGYVLAVRADEANYHRVLDILDHDGAVDLDEREATWRKEGWTGFAADKRDTTSAAAVAPAAFAATATTNKTGKASPTGSVARSTAAVPVAAPSTAAAASTTVKGTDEVIPLYEEQLNVGKRDVNHGRVRVRSYVVETPVNEQISLRNESVHVERRPVNRPVAAGEALFQDRTIEAEEHVEEAVIAKEARVKEEITLRKTVDDRSQTISDSVRRTEVEVQDERGHGVATTAQLAGSSDRIVEHMDVIASDGTKIGTVDHLDGPDNIKLAKSTAPDGQHHYIPLAWVDHVDTHVHLRKTSVEAKAGW